MRIYVLLRKSNRVGMIGGVLIIAYFISYNFILTLHVLDLLKAKSFRMIIVYTVEKGE
ncbi:hypothetical protein [Bacillus sp. SM2101]|uniref:hypothetical protein n=1 Tax=Bacillus sp. SM2101 TaxID=2805366 RepID=UPI001BDEFFE2|nr:hypothetical protein [Bacillus sp. SM2101]